MTDASRKLLLCSCEDSLPIDVVAVGKGCPGMAISNARHLCRSEIAKFTAAAAEGDVTVACTQEVSRFTDVAAAQGLGARLTFVNVRETAGWSIEAASAAPKMAALIAAAAIESPPPPAVTFKTDGVTLILGSDQTAVAAAAQLADRLDITVLIIPGVEISPLRRAEWPVRFGRVRVATGHLGAFEVTIDGYAEPLASSRSFLVPGSAHNGAVSRPEIIIDLTGNAPLFAAHDIRDGYLRADPHNPVEVQRVLFKAIDLTGTFDKPRYITYSADLCVHGRSRINGCTRCLDVCPTGAIAPAGTNVAIDPYICGGCGACAAVCPTGAASYEVPSAETIMRRVRAALTAYRRAGGEKAPIILFHDGGHGEELIFAASRFGDGLPANVIPLAVNEVTQLGLEQFIACLAFGAGGVRVLARAKPKHDIASLRTTLGLADRLAQALGYGSQASVAIETDDPDALIATLGEPANSIPSPKPASFLPLGGKRDILKLAVREMHRAAPAPADIVALPASAPFGTVHVASDGCTLCLACVSACPPHALTANIESPELKFDESLCVQCGLCQATCPEKVITLEPRLNFLAFEAAPVVLRREEPFCCTRCAKPFGVKSTVERVLKKLQGRHWMFSGDNASRLDVIKMCDTCRVEVMTTQKFDPYAGPTRAAAKTSDDYLREREAAMQAKIAKGDA